MTSCDRILRHLFLVLAGEEGSESNSVVAEHIAACESCRAEASNLNDLDRILSPSIAPSPPDDLVASILSRSTPELKERARVSRLSAVTEDLSLSRLRRCCAAIDDKARGGPENREAGAIGGDGDGPFGAFEIRGLLGRGGMGQVHEAYDKALQRVVAIKELAPQLARDEKFVERFLREARAVARLEHENVLRIHHLGTRSDTGYPFLVLEFIDGESLEERVESKGRLEPLEALDMIRQAIRGLAAAFDAGVVHRDVKPSNFMVTKQGRIKVMDFGLARLLESKGSLTGETSMLGTPHYMAPEAGRGMFQDQVSDIYSLGVTLFNLLTGRVPFEGPTPMAIIMQHAFDPMPDLRALRPDLPEVCIRLVERMTNKNVEERHPTYAALAADVDEAIRCCRSGLTIQDPDGVLVADGATGTGAEPAVAVAGAKAAVDPVVAAGYEQMTPSGGLRSLGIMALLAVAIACAGTLAVTMGFVDGASFIWTHGGEPPIEGESFRTTLGSSMTWIPPGEFLMGSPETEANRRRNEGPVRLVRVREGFWMGTHPVTQAEYLEIVEDNPSRFVGPSRPVEGLSWEDAVAFCRHLSRREAQAGRLPEGYVYSLPTEAQWEYACRGGETNPLRESSSLAEFAWYRGSPRRSPGEWDLQLWSEDRYPRIWKGTRPVGLLAPNAWGLYDLLGNVTELCLDVWHDDYEGAPDDARAREGRYVNRRVHRGGSWQSEGHALRPAARSWTSVDDGEHGFRLSLVRAEPIRPMVPIDPTAWKRIDAEPGSNFKNALEMNMAWIPPGSFRMGAVSTDSNAGEIDRAGGRLVQITQGFWMAIHPVTQEQYETLMGENPSHYRGPSRPVDSVSYEQALAFCRRLSAREAEQGRLPDGFVYDLPSSAQWEYACRAGTTTMLPSGHNVTATRFDQGCPKLDEIAWYEGSSTTLPTIWDPVTYPESAYPGLWKGTKPVGLLLPNRWGLYDTIGNVLEWCKDSSYGPQDGQPADERPYVREGFHTNVCRGGSHVSRSTDCNVLSITNVVRTEASPATGFRVVLVRMES